MEVGGNCTKEPSILLPGSKLVSWVRWGALEYESVPDACTEVRIRNGGTSISGHRTSGHGDCLFVFASLLFVYFFSLFFLLSSNLSLPRKKPLEKKA